MYMRTDCNIPCPQDEFIVVVVVHPTNYTCEHLGHELLDSIKMIPSSNSSVPDPNIVQSYNKLVETSVLCVSEINFKLHFCI